MILDLSDFTRIGYQSVPVCHVFAASDISCQANVTTNKQYTPEVQHGPPENQPLEKEIPFGFHHFQVPAIKLSGKQRIEAETSTEYSRA